MKENEWSVVSRKYYLYAKDTWVNELNFYKIDLSNVDFKSDPRFMEIEKMRQECIYLGTAIIDAWPVEFPIQLNTGRLINKGEYESPFYEE